MGMGAPAQSWGQKLSQPANRDGAVPVLGKCESARPEKKSQGEFPEHQQASGTRPAPLPVKVRKGLVESIPFRV